MKRGGKEKLPNMQMHALERAPESEQQGNGGKTERKLSGKKGRAW